MTEVRLPEGGKAWFVRSRRRGRCHMKPVSLEGHLLTTGFVAWVGGVAWWLTDRDELGFAGLAVAVVLILASTLLYIVTALRMSAPGGKGR